MSDKVSIRPLSTGVPGLDGELGGGVPEFSFNVIAGTPGAGKTTLAQQIMFALAHDERPAIFFTVLGEPPLKCSAISSSSSSSTSWPRPRLT